MELNIVKLRELMQQKANNNYNEFARLTKVNVSLLYKILNRQQKAGVKTMTKLISFFRENGLSVEDFIFLS